MSLSIYYVFDYTTNKPLYINNKRIESYNKGPLLNWLQKSVLMLNHENKGDLAGRNLVGHKLAIFTERINHNA